MDYSGVFAGLSVLGAVAAIIGAGVLMAVPELGRWLTNKVTSFFTDPNGDDEDQEEVEEVPCAECGELRISADLSDDGLCMYCYGDYDSGDGYGRRL